MASPIRKDVACFLHCVMAAIVCLIALAVPARAFADIPTIAYDGNARQLTVSGATDSSGEPDLFPAFKDLMPGDVREQQIGVRATGVKSQVRVFVRAVVDHETAHLLSPITGPARRRRRGRRRLPVGSRRERRAACLPIPRRSQRLRAMAARYSICN